MQTYILLDRSGSMQSLWDEALNSVNAYVDELSRPDPKTGLFVESQTTFATFDKHRQTSGFVEIIRDRVSPSNWVPVSDDEVHPRGLTPLFDAIGEIVARAKREGGEKVIFVVMTDGHENASVEMTAKSTKALIEDVKARGWEFVFLGANFADFSDANAIGVRGQQTMAMEQGSFRAVKRRVAQKSREWASGQSKSVDFDAADRAAAGERNIRKDKS